jgi:hypothetical protein
LLEFIFSYKNWHGLSPQLCGLGTVSPMCGRDSATAHRASPRDAREQRGDARNPFQGPVGNEQRWEGEVDGGGFGRNNYGEGSQEQGEGGALDVWWRLGGGSL